MRAVVFALALMPVLHCPASAAAAFQPAKSDQTPTASGQFPSLSSKLLGLTNEWVRTWNEKNANGMQQLYGAGMLYGFGQSFVTGEALVDLLRRENFWGLSWSLKAENPQVRMLGPDAALVWFRLDGQETGNGRSRPYSALFSLVFQRQNGQWRIIHIQDGDCPDSASSQLDTKR